MGDPTPEANRSPGVLQIENLDPCSQLSEPQKAAKWRGAEWQKFHSPPAPNNLQAYHLLAKPQFPTVASSASSQEWFPATLMETLARLEVDLKRNTEAVMLGAWGVVDAGDADPGDMKSSS